MLDILAIIFLLIVLPILTLLDVYLVTQKNIFFEYGHPLMTTDEHESKRRQALGYDK